jgi:DNA-binding response OmpR family regulator
MTQPRATSHSPAGEDATRESKPPLDDQKSPCILVVEDEPKTRTSIAEAFRLEGWGVAEASRGREMISLLIPRSFDVVVLDWMLPGRDGLELLQHVRTRGNHIPVLMLTARSGIDDRVIGLESGADDYLAKPFAMAELVARCRALMRRQTPNGRLPLRCGDLELDVRARAARRGDVEIPLTPKEVDVLEYLLTHQGTIVSREMLERDVWKQTHRFTSLDNVIDVQMMRLRRKIDTEGKAPLIHTIRGVGYQLGSETT